MLKKVIVLAIVLVALTTYNHLNAQKSSEADSIETVE